MCRDPAAVEEPDSQRRLRGGVHWRDRVVDCGRRVVGRCVWSGRGGSSVRVDSLAVRDPPVRGAALASPQAWCDRGRACRGRVFVAARSEGGGGGIVSGRRRSLAFVRGRDGNGGVPRSVASCVGLRDFRLRPIAGEGLQRSLWSELDRMVACRMHEECASTTVSKAVLCKGTSPDGAVDGRRRGATGWTARVAERSGIQPDQVAAATRRVRVLPRWSARSRGSGLGRSSAVTMAYDRMHQRHSRERGNTVESMH